MERGKTILDAWGCVCPSGASYYYESRAVEEVFEDESHGIN